MAWYLYIARCADGSLYTGITTDLRARLRRHNTGRGSAYVRSRGQATLVYAEPCDDRSDALRREATVKAWRRVDKLQLIGQGTTRRAIRTQRGCGGAAKRV